ncbi:Uncharacterized protein DBV15_01035 [Temnothorax longispinosus]|uniref:Uncharacterized protein n=1 Tax=Temnothorax longispinosus TaxID=300112 RepID=A0A4S2JBY5_9HYME|nr:Uncharacterized protein DBV15_01035 [Temnothorax longispinosus]
MKNMYAVMTTGGPVRSIDSGGASAARRAVKTTLKNLKRWCARLRCGTTARDFKNNQQNQPGGIKTYDEDTTMTTIVDQEESRNRANENLENELRESLASNDLRRTVPSMMTTIADVNLVINGLIEDDEPPILEIRSGDRRSSSGRNEDFKVALVALKIT